MKGKINMRRYFQVLGICLAVLLIGLLGGLGFGFWQTNEDGLSGDEIATVETSGGKINVLLMGLDEGGLRTDCIMVGSYDTEAKTAKLLSIPRDTRMYIGSRYQKINAAHAISASGGGIAGAQGTVEAVTRLTGIPINYYVELPFDAVAECIDLLGPVTFEIPDLYNDGVGMVYDDPVQDLHINLKPGVQELNGDQVVQLLRYRKGNRVNGVRKMYANGDIGRIEVQQQFLQALVDQKLNASLILKIPALFKQLSDSIKTNFTVKDVIKYSKYLTDFSSENLKTFSLPGSPSTIDKVSYFVCDLEETRTLIETEFGYDASKITIEKEATSTVAPAAAKSTSAPSEKASATKKPQTSSSGATKAPQATSKSTNAPKKPSTGASSSSADDAEEDAEEKPVSTKSPASETSKTSKPAAEKTAAPPTKAPVKNETPEKSESPAKTKTPVKDSAGGGEESDE